MKLSTASNRSPVSSVGFLLPAPRVRERLASITNMMFQRVAALAGAGSAAETVIGKTPAAINSKTKINSALLNAFFIVFSSFFPPLFDKGVKFAALHLSGKCFNAHQAHQIIYA